MARSHVVRLTRELGEPLARRRVGDHDEPLPLAEAGARGSADRPHDALRHVTRNGIGPVTPYHAPSLEKLAEFQGRDNTSMSVTRRRVIVHGHVQGVFFRDSLRRLAQQRRVAGWVRNNRDGTVEAVLEGEPEAVQRVIDFCSEGPRGARVERVEVVEEEPQGVGGFSVA